MKNPIYLVHLIAAVVATLSSIWLSPTLTFVSFLFGAACYMATLFASLISYHVIKALRQEQ